MTPAPDHPLPFPSLDAQVHAPGLAPATLARLRTRWGYGAGKAGKRRISVTPGPLPPLPGLPPRPVAVSDQTLAVVVRGDELWLPGELYLRVSDGQARITVNGGPVSEAAWTLALVEAHRAGGWLPLHAAVVARGGRGVAVAGVSGAGKSTAALRLAGAGFDLIAEDHTWLRPEGSLTLGLDTHLRAHEDSVRHFAPHLLAASAGFDAHGKLMLPLTEPGGRAALTALLVLGLPERPGPAERVRALWETTGVPLTGMGRRAASAGVQALLGNVEVRGVDRDGVLEEVRRLLTVS